MDHIRLLKMVWSAETYTLAFTITAFPLSSAPGYGALSYRWVHRNLTHTILVNGHRHHVTENLFHALGDVRQHQHQDLLWVDAICINQSDVDERSRQVQLMGEISARASTAYAYLGPGTEQSELAFDALEMLGDSDTGDDNNAYPERLVNNWKQYHRAFESLIRSDYFTRTWIVPEFIIPQWLLLFSGQHAADWHLLLRPLRFFPHLAKGTPTRWRSNYAATKSLIIKNQRSDVICRSW